MPSDNAPQTIPLASVLGAIMADIARARVIADQESIRIAQAYAEDPLLRTMSIPRIRLPQITLDLPVLLQDVSGPRSPVPSSPENVAAAARMAVEGFLRAQGLSPVSAFVSALADALQMRLRTVWESAPRDSTYPDAMADEAARALKDMLAKPEVSPPQLSDAQRADVTEAVRRAARTNAWQDPGSASSTGVVIDTAHVKELGTSLSITRLQVTLREEGLEWKQVDRADGSVSRRLQPE